jgi:hypothetical protein
MKPIYLTKGGKRLVMAKHMKKMSSATWLNANGNVPCKILKYESDCPFSIFKLFLGSNH